MNTNCEPISYYCDYNEYIHTVEELQQYIEISPVENKIYKKIIERHPMRITQYYMSLIDKNDPDDPIRKMAVPSKDELNLTGSYDTSGEHENTKLPGLQHKYPQTALILSTNKCEMYCRHCFRKRLVGLPGEEIINRFDKAINYIKKHKEINNVLISGGDPLTLSTEILAKFLDGLHSIEHIEFIRIGSRIPVALPDRILKDENLLKLFKKYSKPNKRIYLITQFNHPRELTDLSIEAISGLIESNVMLNNQAVLLKGVNDDPVTLSELMNRLVSNGVNPYYIFQCRPVKMVQTNFQVSLEQGCKIIDETKKHCSGLSKRFKYIMSHKSGKIEIIGTIDNEIYFKYLQSKQNDNMGKLLKRKLNTTAGWLDELDYVG